MPLLPLPPPLTIYALPGLRRRSILPALCQRLLVLHTGIESNTWPVRSAVYLSELDLQHMAWFGNRSGSVRATNPAHRILRFVMVGSMCLHYDKCERGHVGRITHGLCDYVFAKSQCSGGEANGKLGAIARINSSPARGLHVTHTYKRVSPIAAASILAFSLRLDSRLVVELLAVPLKTTASPLHLCGNLHCEVRGVGDAPPPLGTRTCESG